MMIPSDKIPFRHLRPRCLASFAFHLVLLSLPAIVGWQEPAKAAGSIGSFACFCSLHPPMTGKVAVKPGAG